MKRLLFALMSVLNYVRACLRSANLKRALVCSCLLAALICGLTACSSDDSSSAGSAESYFTSSMYSTQEGDVYFYRNGSFLFEMDEAKLSGGMMGGFDDFVAIGTWNAVGDELTTVLLANNIGQSAARRNVPEKIRIDDKHILWNVATGEPVIYNRAFGFTDPTNAGAHDNGVNGSWRTDYYPEGLGISVKPKYYADLASDGTATLSGEEGSGLEVKTNYTASRGTITFEKFLNGKRESFYYAFTNRGGMFFYDMNTGSSLFCWYKRK